MASEPRDNESTGGIERAVFAESTVRHERAVALKSTKVGERAIIE